MDASITDWPYQYIALLIALVGTLVSLLGIRFSHSRDEGKERPYFVFDSILVRVGEGPSAVFSYESEHKKLPVYADGGPLLLRLRNEGPEARGYEVESLCDTDYHSQNYYHYEKRGYLEIGYHFQRAKIGKIERFKIRYETVSGRRESQIWEHPHGTEAAKRKKVKKG